jgi:RimJ/RimL family protein N-acetyltransferase
MCCVFWDCLEMTVIDDLPRFVPPPDSRPDDVPWPPMNWPVPPRTTLRSDLVNLSQVSPADVPELFAALNHPEVWTHVAARPAAPSALAEAIAARPRDWCTWLVRLNAPHRGVAAGRVVGTTCYLDGEPAAARLEIGSTSYTPAVWGGAVNAETKLLLLRYAFEVLGAGRVQLKTDIRNVRSQQAIARLGARYEGILRRYQRRTDGSIRDTVMFSITVEEWPGVQARLQARIERS